MFKGWFKRNVTPETPVKNTHKRHRHHQDHVRFAAAKTNEQALTLFDGGGLSADEGLRRDLDRLRKASRKAGEDNGYVKRYFGMVQTHVVGENGFTFQSRINMASGGLDKLANAIVEAGWKEWCKLGVGEISGKMSFAGVQELIAKTVAQDGDILIRHVYDSSNRFGYSIQLIESDYLDATLNTTLKNGNRIVMGVEQDGFGRDIAYHLLSHHPGDMSWSFNGRKYIRVPANEITLPFPMWRPGQSRGVPWAHAALLDFHHVNEYRGTEQVRARASAENMGVYERDPEMDVAEDFEDEEGEFLDELGGVGATVVPEGYKLRETNYSGPVTNFPDFQKANVRAGAAGIEANYNVVGNDYEGVSFSSLRQAVLEDRDHWKRKQRWMIESILEPIFSRWLNSALLRGALPTLEAWDVARLNAPTFQGRRWQWVDPVKDEQATGLALQNFTADPLKILREKGHDLQEHKANWNLYLDEMESVMKRAHAMGIAKSHAAPNKDKPDDKPDTDNTTEEAAD